MENDIKKYYFSQVVAKDVGFEEAVMLSNIYFWVKKNTENHINYEQERYWTYNPIIKFVEQYPFWSEGQIRRILLNLERKQYIETGSFNKLGFDKTKWYTVTEKTFDILAKDDAFTEIGRVF